MYADGLKSKGIVLQRQKVRSDVCGSGDEGGANSPVPDQMQGWFLFHVEHPGNSAQNGNVPRGTKTGLAQFGHSFNSEQRNENAPQPN
jgi:hypothetical protein